MAKKKVLYIVGTGRSGSTLLEITLGNSKDIFDAGELVRFFKKEGKPHGFSEESDNFMFWQKISDLFFSIYPNVSYSELYRLCNKIEYHKQFIRNLLQLKNKSLTSQYEKIINDLFNVIFSQIEEDWLIDSSKYPGRALALERYLNYEVYYIYLIRNPKGVVKSLGKKNIEQYSQSFLSANIYYFIINLYANIIKVLIPKRRFISVKYENFIYDPIKELRRIERKFDINMYKPCHILKTNSPLKPGLLFDGNRIRMNSEIYLKRSNVKFKKNFKNILTDLVNGIWYYTVK